MIRKQLVSWQWSDYFAKHRSPLNLYVHIVAVPMFWVAWCFVVFSIKSWEYLLLGIFLMLGSFGLQGWGHRFEQEKPAAFDGFGDFVSRFLIEQIVTFPRYVLSGAWLRSLRQQ
jgi:uncharacterized membrane protein YGL010W